MSARKYVVSETPPELTWMNSVRISGDVCAEVERLKAQDGPLLQVHGSWQLIQTLLVNDLIDEYRLWIFPRLVGGGKRLFEAGAPVGPLQLIKTEPTSNGAVMCIYRRQPHGSPVVAGG